MLPRILFAGFFSCLSASAFANDSVAVLGAGGLILSHSDDISMEQEDLFISEEKVTVDYVFRNTSDKDVESIVAFPMPDIEGNPYTRPDIPDDQVDNFLGFQLAIEGKPVNPQLDHRAVAAGIDVTDDLKAQAVPLNPFGDAATQALAKLPDDVAGQWIDRGIITIEEYDDGSGMKKVRTPFWLLRSTYWWKATFPAGQAIKVSHRYRPSVGASVGLNFFSDGKFQGDAYPQYKQRYCMDAAFERAVAKAAKTDSPDGYPSLYETTLAYILTTGGNWANGSIGKFKLTVDKGDPKNLISFCGEHVKKTGPTTFEMTAEDFYPRRDLDILILAAPKRDNSGAEPAQGGAGGGSGG